jgi:hypothetical protein
MRDGYVASLLSRPMMGPGTPESEDGSCVHGELTREMSSSHGEILIISAYKNFERQVFFRPRGKSPRETAKYSG